MAGETRELLVGTTNRSKAVEIAEVLGPKGIRVLTLKDLGPAPEVVEDGDSFAEHAEKKAVAYARHFRRWTLADDSGIEVHALGGAPGVHSAYYAGPNATDAENNAKLLEELAGVPEAKRTANYYCHVSVADPTGAVRCTAVGVCQGRVRNEPAGSNGFGYDPLFEIAELHQTFGELGPHVKKMLSHRGRATRAAMRRLEQLAAAGEWTA